MGLFSNQYVVIEAAQGISNTTFGTTWNVGKRLTSIWHVGLKYWDTHGTAKVHFPPVLLKGTCLLHLHIVWFLLIILVWWLNYLLLGIGYCYWSIWSHLMITELLILYPVVLYGRRSQQWHAILCFRTNFHISRRTRKHNHIW